MAHPFSDPLTSVAYASSTIESADDPLSQALKSSREPRKGVVGPLNNATLAKNYTSNNSSGSSSNTTKPATTASTRPGAKAAGGNIKSSGSGGAGLASGEGNVTRGNRASVDTVGGSTSTFSSDPLSTPVHDPLGSPAQKSRSRGEHGQSSYARSILDNSATANRKSPTLNVPVHPGRPSAREPAEPSPARAVKASSSAAGRSTENTGASPYGRTGGWQESNSNSANNNLNKRATIASYTPQYTASPLESPAPGSPTTPAMPTDSRRASAMVGRSPLSDSEDDGANRRPKPSRHQSQYEAQRVDSRSIKQPLYLHITIPDSDKRTKDGMFLLHAQTNLPRYKRKSYKNITRSYVEFERLREHLVTEHPEVVVPVLPLEKSLVTMSDITSLRLFLDRISRHPVLSLDYELQMFVESEFGFLPPVKPTKILGKLLNMRVKRFSMSSSNLLSGDDTDDEFEEERLNGVKVENRLQIMSKALDKEIKARRDFSSKESDLATLTSSLSTVEESPMLSKTYRQLSKALDGLSKASKAQVGGDVVVLSSFLEYKIAHVTTLTNALEYRLSVVSEYEAAVKGTDQKRKTMERLRSSASINPDKVTDSIDDLDDAEVFEGNMKQRRDQVSETVQADLLEYRDQCQEDFMIALRQYSRRQIGFERGKLEELLSVGAKIQTLGTNSSVTGVARESDNNTSSS